MFFYNSVCKSWIELFGSEDNRVLKFELSICLIFKDEAPFLKEWLDYHLTIGVSHFYLYNNNSNDDFNIILHDYICRGIVTLINWTEPNSQFKAYKHCYDHFKNETKWISFIDADEFICPKYEDNVCRWLQRFSKYPAINVQWLMFGTGGVLEHDYKKNVIEQYHSCWTELSPHGKCFINTRYEIANYNTWYLHHHTYMFYKILGFSIVLPAVNQFGYICTIDKIWGGGRNKRQNSTIQINHYFTKAWEIWSSKMHKTDVLFKKNPKSDYSYFYKYEMRAISKDYTINRFLIKMKIHQRLIK